MTTSVQTAERREFESRCEEHRSALRVHCYRMLGSFEDAEDLTQETLLRAWKARDDFEGRASLRNWLYKIATNACLDSKRSSDRRPAVVSLNESDGTTTEITWLQPFPDHLLDQSDDPEVAAIERETIELAYITAIQHLAAKARAVLVLRDVLGWSAADTAETLQITVAGVNSALQRAREGMRQKLPTNRMEWRSGDDTTAAEREAVERYIALCENPTIENCRAVLAEDATFTMPPELGYWVGGETMFNSWIKGGLGSEEFGQIRTKVTSCNRHPAIANYVIKQGDTVARLFAVDVVRIENGMVAEIVAFSGSALDAFDLPDQL